MTIQTHFITEPLLEFGSGQKLEHPQDGLFLYGPVGVPGTPQSLHVGVVGTPDGIALTQKWLTTLVGRIAANRTDQLHTSAWPGFQTAFGVKLVSNPLVKIALDGAEIFNAIRKNNRYDAVRSAVKIFEDAILNHFRVDERRPDVWLIVVPEVVHRYGRPKVVGPKEAIASTIISEKAAAEILRGGGSLFSDMTSEAQIYLFARNFHHQLKAQLLRKQVVVQVVRETTLDPTIELDHFDNPVRSLQEPARIAWNLATTLYFKGARAQPWQIADVRPRVCYVGLVFKEDPSPRQAGDSCCAAQMFLNSGNGVVFRGALGPWRSSKNREFHLSREKATELVAEVIRAYTRDHGTAPEELFIRARRRFSDAEWDDFAPRRTTLADAIQLKPAP